MSQQDANENVNPGADENAQAGDAGTESTGAEDAQRQKDIAKFEKFFRLMDSPVDGEAENAFRMARRTIPKIGVTFGSILEMLDNTAGANEAELLQVIEEYKAANAELKAAEDIIIDENKRLNFLLRNFRDANYAGKDIDARAFKAELKVAAETFGRIHEIASQNPLPADAEELEKYYQARIAAAIKPADLQKRGNLLDRMMVWTLKRMGRDVSPESVMKMQDLVLTQEIIIKEQAALLTDVAEIRKKSDAINEKLEVIMSASGSQALFEEALDHLKKAQLQLGDGEDLNSMKLLNSEMGNEIKLLQQSLTEKDRDIAKIASDLARAKNKPPETVFVDDHGNLKNQSPVAEAQLKLMNYARTLSADFNAPAISNQNAAGVTIEAMQENLNDQRRIISDLQRQLASTTATNALSVNDLNVVKKMESYAPILQQYLDSLEDTKQALKETELQTTGGIFSFFSKRRRQRAAEKKLQRQLENIEKVMGIVRDSSGIVHGLSEKFDERIGTFGEDLTDRLERQFANTNDSVDKLFQKRMEEHDRSLAAASEAYEARLTEAREKYEEVIKGIEDKLVTNADYMMQHEKRLREIETEVEEGLAKYTAKGDTPGTEETLQIRLTAIHKQLVDAMKRNDKPAMDHMLSKGAQIDAPMPTINNWTLLCKAVCDENIDMVEYLLSRKASVLSLTGSKTTLEIALGKSWNSVSCRDKILTMLTEATPKIENADSANVATADADTLRQHMNNMMLRAFDNGDMETFKLALAKGADIDTISSNKMTVLTRSLLNGKWDWAELILQYNPNVLVKNQNGATIYDFIEKSSYYEAADRARAVQILMGLTPDQPMPKPAAPVYDDTMRDFANKLLVRSFDENDMDLCDKALSKGADINIPLGNSQDTLLMKAVKTENMKMFNYVASKKPNINQRDASNRTVFDIAEKKTWSDASAKIAITTQLLNMIPKK